MRVLALVTDAFGGLGGIAQYNRDLLSALSACERITSLVVIPRLGEAEARELPQKVLQLAPISSRLRFSIKALNVASRCGPFDVIFCGHLHLAPLAAVISRMLRKPMWIQVHGVDAWQAPSRLRRTSLEQTELVTAVSRYTRRRILQWAHIAPDRIRVLPNTMRFPVRPRDPSAMLEERYPFAEKPYLITVGRISKADTYKGHRRVLAILGDLRRRHPELQYVIVGEGNDRPDLEALAVRAGVANAVHFLGHVATDEVRALLAAASAFVMPSTKEGFGIVFLEAAAYGLPVIAGNKDGSVDALCDGALGMLIDPDDPAALLEAVSAAVSGRSPPPDPEALARFQFSNFKAHVDALLNLFEPDPTIGRSPSVALEARMA